MAEMKLLRTDSSSSDFLILVSEIDKELNKRYGKSQSKYDKHNKIENIDTAIVGYLNSEPVACGCFKPVDDYTIEIKRMFVRSDYRRKGFSSKLLLYLEEWASELCYTKAVLETGKGQPEAISLYKKHGYTQIENYGPYKILENSVCMEKQSNRQFTPIFTSRTGHGMMHHKFYRRCSHAGG